MILVAGGTGFIGQVLVRQLVDMGKSVRLLIRPSKESPRLMKGTSIEVAVTSMGDERGLRAAFRDVDVLYNLVTDERRGGKADLFGVDVEGTTQLTRIAKEFKIERIVYLSHLGADLGSAFEMLQTKSVSESVIIRSQIPYTIFRSAIVYGPGDQFTTSLARLLKFSPGFVLIPGDGSTLLQPLWVDDLVTCMIMAIENRNTENQILPIGGGEYLSIRQILDVVMEVTGRKRMIFSLSPVTLRTITLILEQFLPRLPISIHWLDYLGSDRTSSLDILPRRFGIIPARFSHHINYLRGL